MSALELTDVEVSYERRGRPPVRAVVGATLAVDAGEIVGLVGESGCGKSTLARVAVGLVEPSRGTVTFDGRLVVPVKRRGRPPGQARLQIVFQDPYSSLNPRRRVGNQIADALAIVHGLPAARRRARTAELLAEVGLADDAASRFPHEFSGGQRQRIAIARALAAEPSILVLDEPLSSLDASVQAQVANLLVGLCRERGIGMLLISHDLAIVHQISDRVAVMYLGEIVEQAGTEQLWKAPLHPYTEALVAAIPRPDGSGTRPLELPGEIPDPAAPPAGCRFHPRCPYAFDRCPQEVPYLLEVAGGHAVACWLHEPGQPPTAPVDRARRSGDVPSASP